MRRRKALVLGACALAAWALSACSRESGPDSTAVTATPASLGEFAQLPSPAGPESGEPRLSATTDGALLMSWLEPTGEAAEMALRFARFDGSNWSAASTVARGNDWVVSAADLPSVRELAPNLLAADWRVPSEASPYAYDIRVALSADGGRTWSDSQLLNDDATPTEHGFVSWFAAGDGRAGVIWLDGRDNASEELASPSGALLGTSLRFAYLSADATIAQQGVIDELACDCCRTDVVATSSGVAMIYRDRSPEEIRDVVVRVRTATGWSEPVTLGPDLWQIEGCPVNGPQLAALGDELAAAWFSAPEGQPRVRAARSDDGGRTFGAAIDIDTQGSLGQVGVVLDVDGTAYVSWWRRAAEGGAELALRTLDRDGALTEPIIVASSPSSRPDSVPQLQRSGSRLVIAWSDDSSTTGVQLLAAELPAH